jgi:hypothetical protein
VNKPVAFVPVIPVPAQGVKRRKSTKTLLAAKCKTCHRETDPSNNRIVFCDACSTAYHQYCHNPPIDNEVVTVLEKEWLCGPCIRAKQTAVEGVQDLIAAENLTIEEVRLHSRSKSASLRELSILTPAETRILQHPPTTPTSRPPPDRYDPTPRTTCISSQRQEPHTRYLSHQVRTPATATLVRPTLHQLPTPTVLYTRPNLLDSEWPHNNEPHTTILITFTFRDGCCRSTTSR